MSTQPHSVQHTVSPCHMARHNTVLCCMPECGTSSIESQSSERSRVCWEEGQFSRESSMVSTTVPDRVWKVRPEKLKCATASSTPSLLCSYTDLGEMIMHTHTQGHSGRRIDRHAADEQHAITSKGKSDGEFRAEICQTDLSPLSPHPPLALSLLLPPSSTPHPTLPFLIAFHCTTHLNVLVGKQPSILQRRHRVDQNGDRAFDL
jgi:hypothetical protein